MQIRTPGQKPKDTHHSRHMYEDPSQKYSDWANRLGLEKTFFGRFVLFLEERFQIRFVIALFLFSFLLAFVMGIEIEAPLNYKLGEVAPVNINSPLSFEMTDEVTTEEKRLKAGEKVLPVFDYDPTLFDRINANIYKSFRVMRSYVKAVQWPKRESEREEVYKDFFRYKSEFDKEIGAHIPDSVFEWLVKNRFSARVENLLIRTIEVWSELKFAEGPDRFIPESTPTVTLRTVQKQGRGKEQIFDKRDLVDIQARENFSLKDVRGAEKLSAEERENLITFAKSLIVPNATPNTQETSLRRQASRESVMPVIISVKKNQPVVTEGTVIQPSHLALFKEIQTLKAERRSDLIAFFVAILFLAFMLVFYSFSRRFSYGKFKLHTKDMTVMGLIILGEVFVIKLFLFLTEGAFVAKFGSLVPENFFLYLAPVAAGPMLVGLLLKGGERVWIFTLFLSIVMGVMEEMNFAFSLVVLAGGIAAARGVFNCKARNDVYYAGVRTGLVNAVVIAALVMMERFDNPQLARDVLMIVPAGFLSGIFSAMLALTFVSILESVFNYTTDVKLLELSNLNHPLLKEMIVKAPGTYHHSMMVGSMVEAAAEEIRANPLLAKVMAYYHDIGKMAHANYFIENQKNGQNPHDTISPYMSKTLLIAHVKDGVELGMQHKLGKPIIDGVVQHHGTTLIAYFYNKAVEMSEEEGSDIPEDEFRYPGPKPQFREAALIMLADSIEAAARSLDEPTPVRLQNIVRNIIQKKFLDGQLDECNLTLKDLTKIETAFTKILLGIYHQRIDYPRSAGGGMSESTPVVTKASQKGPQTV